MTLQVSPTNLKRITSASEAFVCDGDYLYVVVVTGTNSQPADAPEYDGVPMTYIGSAVTGAWTATYFLHLYELASPSAGSNTLVDAVDSGILIGFAIAVGNGNSARAMAVGNGSVDSLTVSGIESAADELLLSCCTDTTMGTAPVTAVSPLRRIAAHVDQVIDASFGVGIRAATISSESLSWSGTDLMSAIAISIQPASSITLPTHAPNLDFVSGAYNTIVGEMSYAGVDDPDWEYSLNGGHTWASLTVIDGAFTISSGVSASTTYQVVVRAKTEDGPGLWSNVVTRTTPAEPVGEVVIEDSAAEYSTGTSASVSLTVPDGLTDSAIIALVTWVSDGYDHATASWNGTPLTRLDGDYNNTISGAILRLASPAVGTHTLTAFAGDPDNDPGGICLHGYVVSNNPSVRGQADAYQTPVGTVTTYGTSATGQTVGDLLLFAIGRGSNGNPITCAELSDLIQDGGSSPALRMASGHLTADSGTESITWGHPSSSGIQNAVLRISLVPGEGGGGTQEPPEGSVSFDCAVGHDAIIPRNLVYDGEDYSFDNPEADPLTFQFRVSTDSGSTWSAAQNYDGQTPFIGLTPGGWVQVQARALNDAGPGPWSASQSYRLHFEGHKHGIGQWQTQSGGFTRGYMHMARDITFTDDGMDGLFTCGGQDRAIVFFDNTGYGNYAAGQAQPYKGTVELVGELDVTYDSAPFTRAAFSYLPNGGNFRGDDNSFVSLSAVNPQLYHGGSAGAYVLSNPASGQNTLAWERSNNSGSVNRSVWFGAVAMERVHQSNPIAGAFHRQGAQYRWNNKRLDWPHAEWGETDRSEDARVACPILASNDEAIVLMTMTYMNIGYVSSWDAEVPPAASPGTSQSGGEGEDPTVASSWGDEPLNAYGNELTMPRSGHPTWDSEGFEVEPLGRNGVWPNYGMGMNWDKDTSLPRPVGIYNGKWINLTGAGGIVAVVLRPSPNMIHSLSTTGTGWICQSYANHGRILIALTDPGDDPPTAQQIRDEIDETEEDEPYSGTFRFSAAYDIEDDGEQGDDIEADPGTYALYAVYETWQGELGALLDDEFTPGGATIEGATSISLGVSSVLAYNQHHVIAGSSTVTLDASAEFAHNIHPSIAGQTTISLSPLADLRLNIHPGIEGETTLSFAVSAVFGEAEEHSISGDVTFSISPGAATVHNIHPQISGLTAIAIEAAAGMLYAQEGSIAGSVTLNLAVASETQYTATPRIIGSVTVHITPDGEMDHNIHPEIEGSVTLTLIPANGNVLLDRPFRNPGLRFLGPVYGVRKLH